MSVGRRGGHHKAIKPVGGSFLLNKTIVHRRLAPLSQLTTYAVSEETAKVKVTRPRTLAFG